MDPNETQDKDENNGVSQDARPMSEDDVHDYKGVTFNENGEQEQNDDDKDKDENIFVTDNIFSLLWHLFKALPWQQKLLVIAGIIGLIALAVVTAWFFVYFFIFFAIAGVIIFILRKIF